MEQFAFIVHPLEAKRDVARKYPIARHLPERLVEWLIKQHSPIVVADVNGIQSSAGAEACGWLVACPLTPRQLTSLPLEFVWSKLEQCGRLAMDHGARILGLGAFTSVVGDGGITLAKRLPGIAITTGNSYTVATAISGSREGGRLMGHEICDSRVAVVGATGSIGATCAEILAREAREVVLIGRDRTKLDSLARRLAETARARLTVCTDVREGLAEARIVITVTSAVDAVIMPDHIASGAVVCDVARPRDVSVRVARERDDVLIMEGGVVAVPGKMSMPLPDRPDEQFYFGFPSGTAYACMSETMILALEGRYENFTLGKNVSVDQVDEINRLADKHGFKLAGFRSFERALAEGDIEKIRSRVHARHATTGCGGAPDPSQK